MAKPAFDAIMKGDLAALKKHPLWDKQSRRRNPLVFSRLQEYESNFMLLAATDGGHTDIAKFLLDEVKVPVDQANRSGETALHRAAYRGRAEILTYLIQKGADIERLKVPEQTTNPDAFLGSALFFAALRGKLNCVRVLLRHGVKITLTPGDDHFQTFSDEIKQEFLTVMKLRKMRLLMEMNTTVRKKHKGKLDELLTTTK